MAIPALVLVCLLQATATGALSLSRARLNNSDSRGSDLFKQWLLEQDHFKAGTASTASAASTAPVALAPRYPNAAVVGSDDWLRHRRDLEKLPLEAAQEPIFTCDSVAAGKGDTPWAAKHREAVAKMCSDKQNRPLMEVFLDKRFKTQYETLYGEDGWLDEAFINYVKVPSAGAVWDVLTAKLVESVYRYSERPIVVVNFGELAPPALDPKRFPNLVLLHARPGSWNDHSGKGRVSFNFNKLRAVLLARAKVGVSVDSDIVMVGKQGEALFTRTKQEITAQYPWPMMPTHYLDRNPDHEHFKKGNFLSYKCKNCPTPTMRWGQAHPSWTYDSMPFLARWLGAKLMGRVEQGVPTAEIAEDEDLLNVALWQEGATKAWCAYQMGGVDFLWENYFPQHAPGPYPSWYDDPVTFKKGVPIAFYFAHAEKKVDEIEKAFAMIDRKKHLTSLKPIFHDMKFYNTFQELKADHPTVNCTL